MKDIQAYPSDDLIKELTRRYENIIIAGSKKPIKIDDSVYFRHYNGNFAACVGLCDIAKRFIMTDFDRLDDIKAEDT